MSLPCNSMEALRAVPGIGRTMSIRTEIADRETSGITVEDTGSDITNHLCADGAPSGSTKDMDGMGFELIIRHRIVETHRGCLHVGNHPDGGAFVRFTLPIARAEEFREA